MSHGFPSAMVTSRSFPTPSLTLPWSLLVPPDKATVDSYSFRLASRWPLSFASSSDFQNSRHMALKQLVLMHPYTSLLLSPPIRLLAPRRRNSIFSLNKKWMHNSSNIQHFECGFLADEVAQPLSLMIWALTLGTRVGEGENWLPQVSLWPLQATCSCGTCSLHTCTMNRWWFYLTHSVTCPQH